MEMPRPSEQDKEFFRSLVPDDPRVEIKPMFGNVGAFVNGNMFMGLFGADLGLKLDEPGREKLLSEPGTGPYGPAERPMGGWVTTPAQWRSSPDAAGPWIQQALEHIGSLPPKKAKMRK